MGWMDGMDGWMDGMDGWDDGWMGWMDGWDGWDGWMRWVDNIPENVIRRVEPYIDSEDLSPEVQSKISRLGLALCLWVRAVYRYHHVAKEVEPIRRHLAQAETKAQDGQAYYYTAGRMCVMSKSGGHFGIDLGMKKSKRDLLDLYFATQCGYGVQWKMKCVS